MSDIKGARSSPERPFFMPPRRMAHGGREKESESIPHTVYGCMPWRRRGEYGACRNGIILRTVTNRAAAGRPLSLKMPACVTLKEESRGIATVGDLPQNRTSSCACHQFLSLSPVNSLITASAGMMQSRPHFVCGRREDRARE